MDRKLSGFGDKYKDLISDRKKETLKLWKKTYKNYIMLDLEIRKREKIIFWGGVCKYLEKFLPENVEIIVDVAAGYCEFINNIQCNCKKIAIDINPDIKKYAGKDIKIFVDHILNMSKYLEENSVSIFFMSNFLEHISKEDIDSLLEHKLLTKKGEIWILTPNIRYVGEKYWDFYDHITPITEKALIEVASVHGFYVKKCISKFLPFTTKSKLPQAAWIVKLYLLLMPFSGNVFGEQSFLILKKM